LEIHWNHFIHIYHNIRIIKGPSNEFNIKVIISINIKERERERERGKREKHKVNKKVINQKKKGV
jgi:hypothetical protein